MANYTSHAIMSDILFDRLNKNNMFKTNIDKNGMKLFSLGQDLTCLDKPFFNYNHAYSSKAFFVTTIKYIYDNNLQYDGDVMAYLYGHIAHYCFDVNIHKYLKKLVDNVNKATILKPHTIIECYMDKYLINKYGSNNSYFNVKKIKNVKNIINYTYRNVYGYFNTSTVYKNAIRFIKIANKGLVYLYKNDNLFNIATKKDNYMNDINFYNYINNDMDDKFNNLLKDSIKNAERTISFVNRYLYRSQRDFYLNLVFDNSPYDSGAITEVKYGLNKIPIYSRIEIK